MSEPIPPKREMSALDIATASEKKRAAERIELGLSNPPSPHSSRFSVLQQMQLPYISEEKTIVLNDLVRSSLFNTKVMGERVRLKEEKVFSFENLSVIYTGEELRQRDADVYFAIFKAGQGQQIGPNNPYIRLTAWQLLGLVGWTRNTNSVKELRDVLLRLQGAIIKVKRTNRNTPTKSDNYQGNLIMEMLFEEVDDMVEGNSWKICINTNIAGQLQPGKMSFLDSETRKKLRRPLGKALHAFFSTHSEPFAMKIEKLHGITGSGLTLRRFRFNLKKACDEMKNRGFLKSWVGNSFSGTLSASKRLL